MTGKALALPNLSLIGSGPLGSLEAYVAQVSSIPMLGREEEMELARRFHEEQDLDAARDLVLSHLRFVVHIARGYMGYGLPVGDLIQEGNVGLMVLEPFIARLAAAYGSSFALQGLSITEWPVVVGSGAALGFLGAWLAAAYHLRRIEPRA